MYLCSEGFQLIQELECGSISTCLSCHNLIMAHKKTFNSVGMNIPQWFETSGNELCISVWYSPCVD